MLLMPVNDAGTGFSMAYLDIAKVVSASGQRI